MVFPFQRYGTRKAGKNPWQRTLRFEGPRGIEPRVYAVGAKAWHCTLRWGSLHVIFCCERCYNNNALSSFAAVRSRYPTKTLEFIMLQNCSIVVCSFLSFSHSRTQIPRGQKSPFCSAHWPLYEMDEIQLRKRWRYDLLRKWEVHLLHTWSTQLKASQRNRRDLVLCAMLRNQSL